MGVVYETRYHHTSNPFFTTIGNSKSCVTPQVSQQAQTPKVLAVEVTYHPAVDLAAGGAVLAELAGRIADLVGPEGPGQPGRCAGMLCCGVCCDMHHCWSAMKAPASVCWTHIRLWRHQELDDKGVDMWV